MIHKCSFVQNLYLYKIRVIVRGNYMEKKKKKSFDITNLSIRQHILDSVTNGISYIKEIEKKGDYSKFERYDLLDIYSKTKVSNLEIRGFGYNTYRILVERLLSVENAESSLEDELKLIEEKEKSETVGLKHIIYQANSVPPKNPIEISEELIIRASTKEELEHYKDMPDILRMFGLRATQKLTIIEWYFSVDMSKEPKLILRIGGEADGEKLAELPISDKNSVYMETQRKQYELLNTCFKLGGNGNFIPVYITEENINPYYFGTKPNYIDVTDLTGKKRIGVNFTNPQILEKIQMFYSKLSKFIKMDIGPIIIATSRLLSIQSPTKSLLDKYIDASILLEALLLPGIDQELKFRTSLRAALLMGKNEEESNKIFDIIKEAYDIRSKIIHGVTKEIDVKKAFPQIFFQLCYNIYLRCLDVYDSESYIKQDYYNKEYQMIFDKIDRSIFHYPKKTIEDVLGLRFVFYEIMEKLDAKK